MEMKYLSLCLPTNGIMEWVFPVLDSIFSQDADIDDYEVIVTDNGDNQEFYECMVNYKEEHANLTYIKTNAYLFENQIEALRAAAGKYLKFMNHRSILEPGAIQWMINLVKANEMEKPSMYWSNGALQLKHPKRCSDFDEFVRCLKHYASWTTGVGVWKEDFEKIPKNHVYNKISPHSDVLFSERHKSEYIIDDQVWSHDIDTCHAQKGKYDLYKAFAVEEPSITLRLFLDGDISADTLKIVIREYEKCVAGFYREFSILHSPCSYILSGFDDAMGIYMSKVKVLIRAYVGLPRTMAAKVCQRLRRLC